MENKLQELALRSALSQFLSGYDQQNVTPQEVFDALSGSYEQWDEFSAKHEISVWQPFQDWNRDDLAELVDVTRDGRLLEYRAVSNYTIEWFKQTLINSEVMRNDPSSF